jgi:hypothetical protein
MRGTAGKLVMALTTALLVQELAGAAEVGVPPPGAWRAATPRPAAALDRPVPIAVLERPLPLPAPAAPQPVVRAQAPETPPAPPLVVGGPIQPVADPPPPIGPPPVGPPPVAPQIPAGPLPGTPNYDAGVNIDRPLQHSFGDRCREFFGMGSGGFNLHCTHCTEDAALISPVSNPFLFEDPRALTELRPLFIYQTAPHGNPDFRGGHVDFFGLQGRVAFTDSWSLVLNKLGFVDVHAPGSDLFGGSGFAEVWLGPKYTFYHDDCGNSAAAVGLTFQIPTGDRRQAQDTGDLTLDPYITYGTSFGRTSYGTFGFVGEFGYAFGVDNRRSDYLHGSLHLDFDIASAHKFYPLIELNWLHYTDSGRARPLNYEGADLINFGSTDVSGRNLLDLALGFRYKFSEHLQTGLVIEFPLGHRDIDDFRLGLDFIVRY